MAGAIALAAVVPVLADHKVRAEQVTQLALGETAAIVDRAGEWRRVCTAFEGYDGWIHSGYIVEVADSVADDWRSRATGWSEGAVVQIDARYLPLPLRARLPVAAGAVELPDGRSGKVTSGNVRDHSAVVARSRTQAAERWALEHFDGSPYQWGGITPWGVDCSGLVQTTFAARGITLPRDSSQQAALGTAIPLNAIQAGDLLFFRSESGSSITHVAFAADGDTLVHSTLACGGALIEPWGPGTRAAPLRQRLVAVRRLEVR